MFLRFNQFAATNLQFEERNLPFVDCFLMPSGFRMNMLGI